MTTTLNQKKAEPKIFFLEIDFSAKEKETRKVLKHSEIREYALRSLKEIKFLHRKISEKLEPYYSGNIQYKNSILKDLDIILNNFLEESKFPKIPEVAELEALKALFFPIKNLCSQLKDHLENTQGKYLEEESYKCEALSKLLQEEQEALNKEAFFRNFLIRIKKEFGDKNPQPKGIYFAYAWPTEKLKKKEGWVQNFLKILKEHLETAGLTTVRLDVISNRYGGNIYEYMQRAEKDDYVLLFGTESLKEKHDGGASAVCTEIIHILKKREKDKEKGKLKVFPVLLSGSSRSSFPTEYERYVVVMNWREKGYVQGLKELYLELLGLSPERYLSKVEEILQQEADSVQKIVKEYIGKRKQFLTSWQNSLPFSSIDYVNSLPSHPLFQSGYKKNPLCKTKILRSSFTFLVAFLFFFIPLFFLEYNGKKIVGVGSRVVAKFLKNQTVEKKPTLFKKKMQGISNFKGTHPDFIGRDNIISALTQAFLHPDISYQNTSHIRMIHGEGGLGKTETAIAFANQHLEDFSLIWWIDVETEASYNIGYRELARALNMVVREEESTPSLVTRVNNYLQEAPFEKPYLLIFDNFEDSFKKLDFYRLLPQRGGAVIITSKIRNIWQIIEMPLFTLEEAIALFQKINPKEKPSLDMEELAKELSYIPLLINAAAHTIEERSSWKAAQYREALTRKIEEQNGLLWQAKDQYKRFDKERTLAASWELTLEHFEKDFPLAFQWLLLCAYFRPTNIPVSWILSWLELQGIKKGQLAMESGNLETALKRFKVLVYDQDTKSFSIHRFWQTIIKAKHKSHKQRILLQMVFLLGKLGEKIYKGVAVTRQEREAWLFHLTSFKELSKKGSYERNEHLATALGLIGEGLWALGRFAEAIHYHTQALEIRRSLFGECHLDIALNLNEIGQSLSNIGKYAEAESYYQKALKMYKALLGETSHLDYAASLNNRGWNLRRLGRVEEGLEYAKQGLEMRKKLLGVEHPDIAWSLNNVGVSLSYLGRCEEAFTYHKAALAMRKKLLGEEHPYVARSLDHVGVSLSYLGKYKEALTYHKTAFTMQKKLLGEEHPDIAWSLNNMGSSLRALGRYKEALALDKAALAMRKKLLGEEHPDTARSLNSVGLSLRALKKNQKALKRQKEAFKMACEIYQQAHPDIILYLESVIYELQHIQDKALIEKFKNELYPLSVKILGENHTQVQNLLKTNSKVSEEKCSQGKSQVDLQKFLIEGAALFMIAMVGMKLFSSTCKRQD